MYRIIIAILKIYQTYSNHTWNQWINKLLFYSWMQNKEFLKIEFHFTTRNGERSITSHKITQLIGNLNESQVKANSMKSKLPGSFQMHYRTLFAKKGYRYQLFPFSTLGNCDLSSRSVTPQTLYESNEFY